MNLVEVQAASEKGTFTSEQLAKMLEYAQGVMPELFNLQNL
jgi:ribonuclease PH